jgi:hypothetical protein
MKKQISGVILTLAALCANLSADGWSNGECCYDPCDSGNSGGLLGGFTIGAEGLYLQAYEDNLEYAAVATIDTVTEGTAPVVTTTTITSQYRRPKFDNRLGYRVSIGYANPCSCWGLDANYFHYNTSARNRVAVPDDLFLIPTDLSSYVVINAADALHYRAGEARLKLSVNRVDLNVGRLFCISDCWEFGPSVGVRWLNLDHRYDIFFLRESDTVPSSDLIRLRDKFDGVGLRGGLNTRWTFCGGFGIYGSVGTAILTGNDRIERFEEPTRAVIPIGGTEVISSSPLFARSRHSRPLWTGETTLGIEWSTTFCGSQTLRILLGWEYQIYFNAAKYDQTAIAAGSLGTSVGAFPVGRPAHRSDLVLQGFVFGATYTF